MCLSFAIGGCVGALPGVLRCWTYIVCKSLRADVSTLKSLKFSNYPFSLNIKDTALTNTSEPIISQDCFYTSERKTKLNMKLFFFSLRTFSEDCGKRNRTWTLTPRGWAPPWAEMFWNERSSQENAVWARLDGFPTWTDFYLPTTLF